MDAKFSQRIKDVLSYSKEEAIRLGNHEIAPEHLMLGILREGEGVAIDVLVSLGANLYQLKKDVESVIAPDGPVKLTDTDNIPLLKTSERILKLVYLEAKSLKKATIDTGHLLLALMKDENSKITRILYEHSIEYEKVRRELISEHLAESEDNDPHADFPHEEDEPMSSYGPQGGGKKGASDAGPKTSSDTPVLDNFGIDLTKAAEEDRMDPIVGREKEIERLAQILSRRKKNNPI
jgi:ATP-dependent Clp protease ATP-binding subunit ClpC